MKLAIWKIRLTLEAVFGCLLATLWADAATAQDLPFERTEERQPCTNYEPLKQPLFGDLHVHTSYSFDSYISSQRNDPWDAYRYAKGEPISLPDEDGNPTITARIGRPLDFTSVTDHSEFLGEINLCTRDAFRLSYWWPHCVMTRSDHFWTQLLSASWWTSLAGMKEEDEPNRSFSCSLSDCDQAHADTWKNIQQAAEDHYDRSSECKFTTFVGYEYTAAPNQNNMHRNVIFRNGNVTSKAISSYETGNYNVQKLWRLLREQCTDAGSGCDVMSIPHNSNISGGLMFRDPQTPEETEARVFFEPVIELLQHKGASECRFDRLLGRGLGTEDELCDFEQLVTDNLTMLGSVHGVVRTERAAAVELDQFGSRNMIRNVLKDGLAFEQKNGTNPFTMGFISSTDTHSATPGAAEEDNYTGHLGRRDSGYRNVQDHLFSNPGGHAVVWAEENSRDAIFEAIRRKETYATSGTRPVVRFFAGADIPEDICTSTELVRLAYEKGVPMGGDLSLSVAEDSVAENPTMASPGFLVIAQKDSGTQTSAGTDLQRAQIIKGWVDANGDTRERVYDVAGDANNGATVDPNTCARVGSGAKQFCEVWQDPAFDANESAFYYVRVLENPSCRWSTLQCQAAGVNPFSEDCVTQAEKATALALDRGAEGDVYGKCCIAKDSRPFYSPIIQERAWTSPIWYRPPLKAQAEVEPL